MGSTLIKKLSAAHDCTPILDDYNKRLEDLVHEIKRLRSTNDKLTTDLRAAHKDIFEHKTLLSSCKTASHTLQTENRTLAGEVQSLKKNAAAKEKVYEHKIRRMAFYEDRRTSKNKLEKILRIENANLRNVNKVLEDVLHMFGGSIGFDSHLLCAVAEYMESVDDECIKRLVKKIVERCRDEQTECQNGAME